MATRTTTTKAKPKTKKVSAKRTAANAKSAVVTKEVKSTKVAKVTKQPRVKASLATVLRRIYALSAGLFLVLAAVAGTMMKPDSYQVTLGHLGKDELASKTNTVFAHADHGLFDVEIRWVLVGLLIASAIVPLLYLTRYAGRHKRGVKEGILPLRWLDGAITGAVMVEVVALLSGVRDLSVLIVVGALIVIAAVLNWLSERQVSIVSRPSKIAYTTSVVSVVLAGLLLASYAVSTWVYGMVRSPWYVYALYAGGVIGAILWA